MNIVLIGPSGAGKGTQAEKLVPGYNLLHISTGDLFRESLQAQTALGIIAKKYMDQGELVPDEVVEAMVEEYLRKADPAKGVLFDGFPRNRSQAKFLDELFKELGRELDLVVYLGVSDEVVVDRLPGRLICRTCQSPYHEIYRPFSTCHNCGGQESYERDDDTPEITRARLREFHRATATLIPSYQEAGRLFIIDGEDDIEAVHQRFIAAIGSVEGAEVRAATPEEAEEIRALKEVRLALPRDQVAHRSLDIILLGAPGSGKGTQAVQLSNLYDVRRIATGDLFRKNIEAQTDLGKVAKRYMDRGELVPDNVTEGMVRERLSRPDTQAGFILDGFPRTLPQAEALTEIMTDMQRRIDSVIYINVPDEEIVGRLSGRLICRDCQSPFHTIHNPFETCPYDRCHGEFLYQREDDSPDTVRTRLRTFHRQTVPLIRYYREAGVLTEIDGVGHVADIFERTVSEIRRITATERI
jgi:adenylate kinase